MNYSNHTYYAHSMQIYNTDREIAERGFLEQLGFNILCPNRDLSLGNDMDAYLRIVARCKNVVCSEYAGFVGKGVYLELKWAMRHKIPRYVLRERTLYHIVRLRIFNDQDWQTTFGKIEEVHSILVAEKLG